MTQREKDIITRYENSTNYNLWHAYEKPSYRKVQAWEHCKALIDTYNGYGLKIIGYNSCYFSVGFMFEENGTNKLMFITAQNEVPITI